jgi:hypothetical protein
VVGGRPVTGIHDMAMLPLSFVGRIVVSLMTLFCFSVPPTPT